jgi:hypothetical protein
MERIETLLLSAMFCFLVDYDFRSACSKPLAITKGGLLKTLMSTVTKHNWKIKLYIFPSPTIGYIFC